MGSFFDKIRAIKNGLFAKNKAHDNKQYYAPSHKATHEAQASQSQERAPYYIQIGFDFGTSFSKCIYRDISKNKAWVYCSKSLDVENPFLIPSSIIFHDGIFRRHTDLHVQYPQHGLFHLKFAIERIACGDIQAEVLSGYKKAIGSAATSKVSEFVKECAVFYLSSSFATVIKDIRHRFSDFGRHPDDQLAINMAIPVASASQSHIRSYYEDILKKAWAVSHKLKDDDCMPHKKLQQLIQESDVQNISDELCAVYPEVSANVQAFIRSPASSPNERTIYFFSDTGAGTVDQSVFTYTPHTDKLNYFAAVVLPLGSSHIDMKACGDKITLDSLEYWRKEKESGSNHAALKSAKQEIEEHLRKDFYGKTLRETKKRLHNEKSITHESTLKEHARLIFGGGGHSDIPYKSGIMQAFNQIFNAKTQPDITSIQTPNDIELNGYGDRWMKRLFVAYGLSFATAELANNTYPDDNLIEVTKVLPTNKDCTCRGRYKNCYKCGGTGVID